MEDTFLHIHIYIYVYVYLFKCVYVKCEGETVPIVNLHMPQNHQIELVFPNNSKQLTQMCGELLKIDCS